MSCTSTNSVVSPTQKPNVQAYLAPGQPITLNLSTVIAYSDITTPDSISRPIDGQSIKIKTSDGKVFNLKSIGNGDYVSAKNEVVKFGIGYTLELNFDGLPISATTTIPQKPTGFKLDKNSISRTQRDFSQGFGGGGGPMGGGGPGGTQDDNTPIVASWNNPTGDYYFVAQLSQEANPEYVIITAANNTNNVGREIRRQINNQPTTTSLANIQPGSFQLFGKYAIILYRLNPDYAALYRSGGTSSQNISTPPTAITNALGIFTGVNTDTLSVTVLKK